MADRLAIVTVSFQEVGENTSRRLRKRKCNVNVMALERRFRLRYLREYELLSLNSVKVRAGDAGYLLNALALTQHGSHCGSDLVLVQRGAVQVVVHGQETSLPPVLPSSEAQEFHHSFQDVPKADCEKKGEWL